jgi:hypothetical protein
MIARKANQLAMVDITPSLYYDIVVKHLEIYLIPDALNGNNLFPYLY